MLIVGEAWKKFGDVSRFIPASGSLPDLGDTILNIPQDRLLQEPDINKIQRFGSETSCNNLARSNGDNIS